MPVFAAKFMVAMDECIHRVFIGVISGVTANRSHPPPMALFLALVSHLPIPVICNVQGIPDNTA